MILTSKIFLEISSSRFSQYIAVRKGMTHSERKVLQMQKEMNVSDEPLDQELPDEELIDTLIAISVVSKKLATKLRVIKEKGEQADGSY
jgi:hypothetical protein